MGMWFRARAIIITTGTFLMGRLHVGDQQQDGGRMGEPPARGLSASLKELGIRLGRLKTGTPCRIDGRTIDYQGLECQPGDLRAKFPQPQHQPRALESGVASDQHASTRIDVAEQTQGHTFQGALPDCQSSSSLVLSRKVSIGCQKPRCV